MLFFILPYVEVSLLTPQNSPAIGLLSPRLQLLFSHPEPKHPFSAENLKKPQASKQGRIVLHGLFRKVSHYEYPH